MKKLNIKSKRGFTIIEVVLVLAIAGLIFLMVFIALPNMQASRRNTQRKNDYASLSTKISEYASANNGALPSKIKKTWLNSTGNDPDGESYTETDVLTFKAGQTNSFNSNTHKPDRNTNQVYIITDATCTDGAPSTKTGKRNFVVYGYVEEGTEKGTYCLASNA